MLILQRKAGESLLIGEEIEISGADSKVHVVVIPTDEEMMIAQDTAALV